MDILTRFAGEELLLRNSLITLVLMVTIVILRAMALRMVGSLQWSSETVQLRWNAQVRNFSVGFLTLGMVVIWASELQSLALSVVAIAVALVIATKELILCVSGSVLRASSQAYGLGDRIEVDGHRGDVIKIGFFTTTILEVGASHQRTGRSIVIPNAVLLGQSLSNASTTESFVIHSMTVSVSEEEWEEAESRLLAAATQVSAPVLKEARTHLNRVARRHGLPSFSVEPSVHLQVSAPGRLELLVRVPARAQEKGAAEQAILRRFYTQAARQSAEAEPITLAS